MIVNHLNITNASKKRYRLVAPPPAPIQACGYKFELLPGSESDGSSIPWIVQWRYGHPFAGDTLAGGWLHDQLYAAKLFPRDVCDRIAFAVWRQDGVSEAKAREMHRGVRLGGWWRWWRVKPAETAAARQTLRVTSADGTVICGPPTRQPPPDALMDGALALIAVLLAALALLGTGCANLKVELPTGEKVSYSRVGDQKIGLAVEWRPDGSGKASLQQQSEAAALTEMARTVNKLAELAGAK